VRQGCLYVPADRPGLGINLNLDTLQKYEVSGENTAN
jgi:L-alanine-DL-glutamate epimerase-like enolase superfamily enzyme